MIKITLELYAAVCVFATITFVALAFASRRKSKFDDLESMKEFDCQSARKIDPRSASVRRNWADSEPRRVASGRTGVRAIAGVPLQAQNRLVRVYGVNTAQPGARIAVFTGAMKRGSVSLRRRRVRLLSSSATPSPASQFQSPQLGRGCWSALARWDLWDVSGKVSAA